MYNVGFVIKEYTKPITLTGLFINAHKITFCNWYFFKTFFFLNFLENFWDPKGFWLKLLDCENNGLLFGWSGWQRIEYLILTFFNKVIL